MAAKRSDFYTAYVKRALDVAISAGALVALSPALAATALAIKFDSPGPVLFKQKRVGKGKKLFEIYKFRSMRADTPADVPTHQLGDPSARITKVGAFIRRTSIDELPQLANILKGDMSFVGPRPALWNQYDLIEERDRYGANDVVPGLTGWAQVNGRDELEIPVKARYDGEYAADVNFGMDARCFLATIGAALAGDGVVEGGTGQMAEAEQALTEEQQDALVPPEKLEQEVRVGAAVAGGVAAAGIAGAAALAVRHAKGRGAKVPKAAKPGKSRVLPVALATTAAAVVGACVAYDARKKRELEVISPVSNQPQMSGAEHSEPEPPSRPIRVLITGADSYVGTHVEAWLAKWPGRFEVDTVDMKDPSWRECNFSGYDTVFHVAGIAHADVGSVTEEQKAAYYAVNTDLAIECAKKAKAEGAGQFILMSSMIVYGGKAWVDASTEPAPANFYGDSKWRADEGVRALAGDGFRVCVLRPPMIYGRGSKGNYPQLAKLASTLPAFPEVRNRRSMLHIDNLCEFVRLAIEDCAEGVFFPQNDEHVCTSDMVREIAKARGHRIAMVPGMSLPADALAKAPGKVGGLASKAFGDSAYDLAMSEYPRDYRVRGFEESIRLTEGEEADTATALSEVPAQTAQKKVLVLASVASMIDQFNMPNIALLQEMGYEVHVACNFENGSTVSAERVALLKGCLGELGVPCHQIDFDRNALNLGHAAKAYRQVKGLLEQEHFSFVHCHSPIGGAVARMACHETGTKCIYTAHGFHFYDGAPAKNWALFYPMEKMLSRYTDVLVTINHEDYERARTKFHAKKTVYIPGVGVDLSRFEGPFDREAKRAELGLAPGDFAIIAVGELNENKNHRVLVEALPNLPENVKLFVAGVGPLHDELLALAEKLGVADRVCLLGYRSDIPALLNACDLFCMPSLREGLPVSLMEAMASGLPVAASAIRGCEDLVDDEGGRLFDPGDEASAASTLSALSSVDAERLAELGAHNREKIKAFGVDSIVGRLREIYA